MLPDELKPEKDCAKTVQRRCECCQQIGKIHYPTRSLRLFIMQPAYNFDVKEDTIEKAIATLAKETKANMKNEVGMRDDFDKFSRLINTKIEDIQTTSNIIQGSLEKTQKQTQENF